MKSHELIKTEDNSYTLRHSIFDENTHSIHGAYSEALFKHLYPSHLLEKNNSISVIDIGFGLGYNLLALLNETSKRDSKTHITAYSFEYDRTILPFMKKIEFNDSRSEYYKILINLFENRFYENEKTRLKIFFGDARQSIQNSGIDSNSVDAVFHDPHSPGKNSELWTVEFLKQLHNHLKSDGILTTYSRANHIRRALSEAGFYIAANIDSRFHKEGTIATPVKNIDSFDEDKIDKLKEDVKSYPFHDNEKLDLERERIIQNRLDAMKKLRMKNPK
jgi:tRNA U34 5-methylaminomethyl-2-thiouridine-forming methyltransferase MnmC